MRRDFYGNATPFELWELSTSSLPITQPARWQTWTQAGALETDEPYDLTDTRSWNPHSPKAECVEDRLRQHHFSASIRCLWPKQEIAGPCNIYRAGYDFKRLFTISEYYDRDCAAFYSALQSVREVDMDLTAWLEFFVIGLSTQLQEVKSKGEQAIRAAVVAAAKKLNARQASLVAAFMERATLSLSDCEKLLADVTRRTVQRDLTHLVDAGLVREVGAGPTDPTRRYQWLGDEL